jgi:hypothetical protein
LQLEGGTRLGRIYLAATDREWGATGTTFDDEDVSRALETNAAPMTAAAIGRLGTAPGASSHPR